MLMQYLRARFYSASTGRFVGLDPFAGDKVSLRRQVDKIKNKNHGNSSPFAVAFKGASTGWMMPRRTMR